MLYYMTEGRPFGFIHCWMKLKVYNEWEDLCADTELSIVEFQKLAEHLVISVAIFTFELLLFEGYLQVIYV